MQAAYGRKRGGNTLILPSRYYEESLYPLQDGVMNILSKCGVRFFLTGGTALSRAYYNHRYSDDLDFFVIDDDDYLLQVKEVSSKLKENGFFWDSAVDFISHKTFTSFKVGWEKSDTLLKLDFVNDIAVHFGGIVNTDVYYRTDSIRNMLSNKLTAVYRFSAKDVADIREIALRENVDWVQAIEDARQKEAGVDLTLMSEILTSMPKSEFDTIVWVKKPDWDEFQQDIERIVNNMLSGQSDTVCDTLMDTEKDTHIKEAQVDYNRKYTYSDYLKWDDDVRYELIDGVPYLMSAPMVRHQEILGNLYTLLNIFLKGKQCKVYLAPLDVRLNADTYDDTVVQPDIVVICDSKKMMKTGCLGDPDVAVEVLSPSTMRIDNNIKFNKYPQAGVREYWVVDPENKTVAVHILEDGEYLTRAYKDDDKVPVHILEDCVIDLAEVFV